MLDLHNAHDPQARLHDALSTLRQAIIRAEPTVMVDGRFERMITTPLSVLDVARQLIEEIPQLRQ
jgi:hypothetical protein